MSIPYFLAIETERLSGGCPTCQSPIPAESIKYPLLSLARKIPSAKGDRQILPRQTIKIFIMGNVYSTEIFLFKSTSTESRIESRKELIDALQDERFEI